MPLKNWEFKGLQLQADLRDEADHSVWAEIFSHGEYRAAEERIIGAKSVVVDVGAHAGFFTMYVRSLNPMVEIVAIEPEERNLAALRSNIKNNGLKKIKVVAAALGSESGAGDLVLSNDSHNHALLDNAYGQVEGSTLTQPVRVMTLHEVREQYKIKRISVIKMDIEGGEYGAFNGMTNEDFASIESVIMEYHDMRTQTHKDIEQMLREHGFGVQIFPSKFDKHMGFLWATNKKIKE
jgi:FkbM family methyltransferase